MWSPRAQPLSSLASHFSYVTLMELVSFAAKWKLISELSWELAIICVNWHTVSISTNGGCLPLENEFSFQASWIWGWNLHLNSELQEQKSPLQQWKGPAGTPVPTLPPNCHVTWQVSSLVWDCLLICKTGIKIVPTFLVCFEHLGQYVRSAEEQALGIVSVWKR